MQRFYVFHRSERGEQIREISRSAFFGWLSVMMQEETPYKWDAYGVATIMWDFEHITFCMSDVD